MKKNNLKLIKNKDFILLFLGGFVSRIGNGIHNIALIWFVLDLTKSGSATGFVLLLSTLPTVIVGPFSGLIADKFNRKNLIVYMDIIRGIVVIWLGYVVYIGIANLFHISIATILIAVATSFFNPAVTASFPNLVQDQLLQKANSLNHFSMNFTQIIGAAIGGLLIAQFGIAAVFLINGVSYLISAFSELFLKIPDVKIEEENIDKSTFLNEIKFGFNYLWSKKEIVTLFTVAILLNFLLTGLMILGIPYIFKEILTVNSKLFGYAQSIFPAGAVVGSLILSQIPEFKEYSKVLFYSLNIQSLTIISLGVLILPALLISLEVMSIYYLLIVVLFISGIFNAIINVPITVLLQRMIPDNLRGRINGLLSTMSMGLVPVSLAVTGLLIDLVPVYSLFMIGGALSLALSLYIIRIPAMNKLNQTNQKESHINSSQEVADLMN